MDSTSKFKIADSITFEIICFVQEYYKDGEDFYIYFLFN